MGEQSDGFDGMEGSLWRNVMSVECGNECLRVEHSVKFRIVSRLTVEPIFKHQLEQWLHSDAADRLHLRCCGSQKITEVRCALLGSDRS